MLENTDIHIRDPFVLPVKEDNLYYLYGTRGSEVWADSATGADYYTSTDLETWEGPYLAFEPPDNFWSDRNFWAPEVHVYNGKYYMFMTFKAEGIRRGTQILVSESPTSLFKPVSRHPVTPASWECLDGTLYVDNDKQPWMIFCHEWVQVGDGEICALPLSKDLTSPVGETRLLFKASAAPWAEELHSKGRRGYVTDGPFLHRTKSDDLLMLWSSFKGGNYAVGIARSKSGEILGEWEQLANPLYTGDGGHCMVFRTFDDQLMLAFHRPNGNPNERPYFVPIREVDGTLEIF